MLFLCVVDGMFFQPVLIANFANVLERTGSDTPGEAAAFPGEACAKTNCATEKRSRECAARRLVVPAMIAQQTEARTEGGRPQSSACRLAEKWRNGFSVEECFLARTRTLESRIHQLSTVINTRF